MNDTTTQNSQPKPEPEAKVITGFRLTIPKTSDVEKAQEEARTQYRRKYWQGYRRRVKRVYGTIPPDEYEALEERAAQHNQSVWAQLWAEAQAYQQNITLPSPEVAQLQRALLVELRRMGNNANQIAKQMN